jgi:hypothetical protein
MTNRLINMALFYNEWFLATHEPPHKKKQEKTRPSSYQLSGRVLGVISNEHYRH